MMNLRQIQDIAGHRDVPPWVIKLVQDCIEHDRMYEQNLNCKSVQKRLATSWGYVLPDENNHDLVIAHMVGY